MPSKRRGTLFFGLLCLVVALQGCGSDNSTNSGGNPGDDDPFEGYLILASFQAALTESGSFTGTVLRLDPSDPSARDCAFTVNQTEIPLVSLASTDDEAVFAKFDWGYDPGTLYTANVSVNGKSAQCSFTAPDYTWVTITAPGDDRGFTPGEAIDLVWEYDGDVPGHVYVGVSGSDGDEDVMLLEEELAGSTTHYTINADKTGEWDSYEELLITVDLGELAWPFTGELASVGSGIGIVLPGDAAILTQGADPGETNWWITAYLDQWTMDADGTSTTQVFVTIQDDFGVDCPNGTTVTFSVTPEGYAGVTPQTVTTTDGEASATVTAGTTAGEVHIVASALGVEEYAELHLNEVIHVTVSQGTHPEINWTPANAMYGMIIRQAGLSIGNVRWTIIGTIGGFHPAVVYGRVPDNAQQLYPLAGAAPIPLTIGTDYQLCLVDAVGDTTFVDFMP
ncbi:MAG: hypothetical protein KJ970_20120 [Candidatus Eisenbacteria bacterium]|uniref:Invasin domain-containing protein n=1 Tax=Eiseniibacteriota bacterium TaxID=2212470 RepID=A0A948RY91_UNCEI|nr:hypothetical protein [Candidatus Eisenbacteria bacterium]MBU1950572.1 hypothetical protein [Candidatus Eisenbacteria bacterium]MBU2693230.1 hypothetical protein [Candidatus Eisenbacteria bacterium]